MRIEANVVALTNNGRVSLRAVRGSSTIYHPTTQPGVRVGRANVATDPLPESLTVRCPAVRRPASWRLWSLDLLERWASLQTSVSRHATWLQIVDVSTTAGRGELESRAVFDCPNGEADMPKLLQWAVRKTPGMGPCRVR